VKEFSSRAYKVYKKRELAKLKRRRTRVPTWRERPHCRKRIEKIVAETGCTLRELRDESYGFAGGMRQQLEKMIAEERIHR
jgi:hypothetical protein